MLHAPVLFLEWVGRHGGKLLAAAILAPVLYGPLGELFRPIVTPSVAVMMTLVLLRIDPAQVMAWLRRPGVVALVSAWMLLATPLIVFAITRLVGLEGSLAAGVTLVAASCAVTTASAFARLVALDAEISLVVSVVTTALLPFTAPPIALGLLGLDLNISVTALMLRLLMIIGIPALVAFALRRRLGQARLEAAAKPLDGAVVLVLVLFAFGVMDGVNARLLADPIWLLGAVGVAMAGSLGLNLLTALLAMPLLGRHAGLTAGLLAGNRNQAVFLAVLPAGADADVLLFFGIGQIPMYVGPFLLRRIYAWLATAPGPPAMRGGG